jgi:hypothetical protein
MSFGAKKTVADPEPEKTGLEDDQISNATESVPVPVFWGQRKIALRWISRVYNQKALEAPASRPGKKG